MKCYISLHFFTSCFTFLLIASPVATAENEKSESTNFLSFDIRGTRANEHPIDRYNINPLFNRLESASTIEKRTAAGNISEVDVENKFTYYQVDVKAGTPFQLVSLSIDIGSADLWIISSNNPYCENSNSKTGSNCSTGTFDYNSSSSFHYNNSDFLTIYQDYTYASGIWATDLVQIGDAQPIYNCSMGVALQSNTSRGQGILGIGFPAVESTNLAYLNTTPYIYENVPQLLRIQQGLDPVAYSMWLNDADAASGQILFGAVDQDKYEGNLFTVPIIPTPFGGGARYYMEVVLSGISIVDINGNSSNIMLGPIAASLDCGTTFTFVPTNVFAAIGQTIGAETLSDNGYFVVDCGLQSGDMAIEFEFSGETISVKFSEFLFQLYSNDGSIYILEDGNPGCALGFMPSDNTFILGDSFLRSVYAVYDLDNNEVSLANAKFNVSSSNVKAIDSNGVPGASQAPNYSATQYQTSVVAQIGTGIFAPGSCKFFQVNNRELKY